MTDAQRSVMEVRPTAFCCYAGDKGTHKVYHLVGQCRVALSQSWNTASMAWHEAAMLLAEKAKVTA